MNSRDIEVKVTHLINPNRFYCCDLTQKDKLEKLRQNENSLISHPLGEVLPHSLLKKVS